MRCLAFRKRLIFELTKGAYMRGKKVKKLLGVMALCAAMATIMPISVLAEDTVQDDNAGQVQEATQEVTQEEGGQNEIRENGQELDESDSDNRENSEDSIMLADENEDILNVKYSAYLHGMDWQEEKSNGWNCWTESSYGSI